jgi:tetratricopeptide (TPR) repeat protein
MPLLVFLLLLAGPMTASAASDEPPALLLARRAYNQAHYDEAIRAAHRALDEGREPDAARLVLARALIERYRQKSAPDDLVQARAALQRIDDERIHGSDRGDLLIALGQVLYLNDNFGAAAELFETALAQPRADEPAALDRALDWWATALDRQAQDITADRERLYGRILERVESEVRYHPGSVAANYWLPVAARGIGDLDRAWQAAIAGWVRAGFAGPAGAKLRADLDRLVGSAIIPDRAREVAVSRPEQQQVTEAMTTAWEQVKRDWPAH